MKQICICFFVGLLLSCYKPNIYNDGTAWKMPGHLKTSDFYYDIENVYQYEGRHQEYMLKIKDFSWQDDTNKNHTIEGSFFIVKSIATGGGIEYQFQYRRYNILEGEVPPEGEIYSDNIRDFWYENGTEIQRGATLYITDSNDNRFTFGMPHCEGWANTDGLYEKYNFSMYFYGKGVSVVEQLIRRATEFRFYFPSDNLQTNGYELEPEELERLKTNGIFVELENNSFSLTAEELENLKKELPKLIAQEKMPPKEYIERTMNERLK
jgi:hypothetical protein